MALRAFQVPLAASVRLPLCCKRLACSHTPSFLSSVCVCVRARAYITRRWLAAVGYDVQIRTVRDYIIVWRGAGFVEFSAWKGRARCSLRSTKRAPRNLSFKFVFSPVKTRDV